MNINRKLKKLLNLYNLSILACIIIIIGSLFIIFKPNNKVTPYGLEVIDTKINEEENISEEKAKEVAIEQFKKIGEKKLKEDKLKVIKIQRNDGEYYYITSPENTLEIKIEGGKITRINSATVEE